MAILTSPAATGSVAAWSDNEDVAAGSVDTDDSAVAGATTQATSVNTGDGTDANSGANVISTGLASSITGARTTGALTVRSGISTAGANPGGVSGAVIVGSGATVGSAQGGGNSGPVTLQSGGTTAPGAGAGGNSGNVIVQSGDTTGVGAGAGGTSGTVVVESGSATEANTGAVTVQTGATTLAGTVSGDVTVQTGTTVSANSGSITIRTGACAAAGTSGDIQLIPGAGPTARGTVIATGFRTLQGTTETGDNLLDFAGSAYTLVAADSGGTWLCVAGGGVVTVNIPAPSGALIGVRYQFVLRTAGAAAFDFDSGAANRLQGVAIQGAAAIQAIDHQTISYTAVNSVVGDTIVMTCTGVTWLVQAVGSNGNSFTFA
jgi:hypothetical protein